MTLVAAGSCWSSFGTFFWDHPIFGNDAWSGVMNVVRAGLPVVLALWLLIAARAAKRARPIPERWQKRVAVGLAILSFGVYFDFFNPNVRYRDFYHRHTFFHDYLGAKYAPEIGYQRLYACAALAESELGHTRVAQRTVRDLNDNLIKSVADTGVLAHPETCKRHFAAARWDEWKQDIAFFYSASAGNYWDNMLQDHGFRYSPVWTLLAKPFTQLGPPSVRLFMALSSIDVVLHVGIVLLLGWAFGWRVMAVGTVFWACNAPANFYWTGGSFLRQDWLFLLVAAVCLARKRHFVLAGAALTTAALAHVFPAVLLSGWVIVIALYTAKQIRRRMAAGPVQRRRAGRSAAGGDRTGAGSADRSGGLREPPRARAPLSLLHPSHRQLIVGCVVALGTLIPASLIVAGPSSYESFANYLLLQRDTPFTNDMGLQTVLTHDWAGRMRFTRNDNIGDPFQQWRQGQLDRGAKYRWVMVAITAFVALWTVWALRRTKLLWAAVPLGLPLFFCVANVVCYYYSIFTVVAVLVAQRKQLSPVILAMGSATQVLLLGYYWVDDKYAAMAWLYLVFSLLILFSYSRPFSLERLRAWWRDRRELALDVESEPTRAT